MSASEKSDSAKSGQKAPATRSGRLLSVVSGKDNRALHLSPILQQIKDDGPAVIDGEVVREGKAVPKLEKPAATAPAAAATPTLVSQPAFADKQIKILLAFCAVLTLGLGCSLYFSYQQQARLETVEGLLQTLVTGER